MEPYYQDGSVTIYHGDCREILPALSSIDYVFTSPPYNRGDMSGGLANLAGGYASYEDEMPAAEYEAWQRDTLRACWDHPAPFPLALPRTALAAVDPGVVLDPFMGSGTTLRAAKDMGHRAIGIEIEERYCEIAAMRCAQEVFAL